MRVCCPSLSWLAAVISLKSLIGNGHASEQRPQETQTSSLMKRAIVWGSIWNASTGQTYRHSAVGHWRQTSWWNEPRPGYACRTAGSTWVAGSLKIRIRGIADKPCSRWTLEQMTSQVRQPMQRVGSGKITPSARVEGLVR